MRDEIRLRPCPFCGHRVRTEDIFTAGNKHVRSWVHCWGCDAIGPPANSEEEAAEKWNGERRWAE